MTATAGDYYLLHEELELFKAPCYFCDFVDRVRVQGLDYLAEAQPEYTFARNDGPTVVVITCSITQTTKYFSSSTLTSPSTDTSVRRCL